MPSTADFAEMARSGDTLDHPGLVTFLDNLDIPSLVALLQAPAVVPVVHMTPRRDRDPSDTRWKPGDGRPSLADEDPAVMCAIARCATARWRSSAKFGDLAATASHPERCGWCDYPAEELDRALRWSEFFSRLIVGEALIWRRGPKSAYRRASGRAGAYENPRWAQFAALSDKDQRFLTDAAVVASRANLEPEPAGPGQPSPANEESGDRSHPSAGSAHVPWCDLRPDHTGPCPAEPPEDPDADH